jgi:hypothetical protein
MVAGWSLGSFVGSVERPPWTFVFWMQIIAAWIFTWILQEILNKKVQEIISEKWRNDEFIYGFQRQSQWHACGLCNVWALKVGKAGWVWAVKVSVSRMAGRNAWISCHTNYAARSLHAGFFVWEPSSWLPGGGNSREGLPLRIMETGVSPYQPQLCIIVQAITHTCIERSKM